MPTDQNPKQSIAQRIKDATNILVTVGKDPSVDELAATLALTLILDKLGKTPTAVFSGKIPPAIEFLNPGKTFDTNVDGLRDFIIALDKEKADRLRYKVEDDVVRVFITPYKTTITEKDLTFSQGDFNVDLIIAFGVEKREDLDTAITAHGRILHDASIVTINREIGNGTLGEVDWNEPDASSLSEMLMSLTESLQSGLLDEPIATAILTGLVSSTDRFRNNNTSPKVMTMAAQLMAAGANQQLIAEKLEEAETVSVAGLQDGVPKKEGQHGKDGEMKVDHDDASPVETQTKKIEKSAEKKDALDTKAESIAAAESADAIEEVNNQLKNIKTQTPSAPVKEPATLVAPVVPTSVKMSSWRDTPAQAPTTGSPLSATSEQAQEDKVAAEEADKNHVILSHDSPAVTSAPVTGSSQSVLNATTLPPVEPTVKDIFATDSTESTVITPLDTATSTVPVSTEPAPVISGASGIAFEETPRITAPAPVTQANPTLADLEAEVQRQTGATPPVQVVDNARAAVNAVFDAQPFNPAGQPLVATGAQPLGDIAHDVPQQTQPPASVSAPEPAKAATSPVGLPPLPPLPPLPDFSTLPPLPGETTPAPSASQPAQGAMPAFGLPEQNSVPASPAANPMFPTTGADPAQFKLPGQS